MGTVLCHKKLTRVVSKKRNLVDRVALVAGNPSSYYPKVFRALNVPAHHQMSDVLGDFLSHGLHVDLEFVPREERDAFGGPYFDELLIKLVEGEDLYATDVVLDIALESQARAHREEQARKARAEATDKMIPVFESPSFAATAHLLRRRVASPYNNTKDDNLKKK